MTGLKIGVDLDGVIDEVNTAVSRLVKNKLGVDVVAISESKKTVDYHLEAWPEIKKLPGGPEFVIKMFNDPELYRQAVLIDGAREVLEKWEREGKNIRILTARPPHLKKVTFEWLAKSGLSWLVEEERVVFNGAENGFQPVDKPRLVNELKLQVFIEDNADTLNKSVSSYLKLKILFNRPWNFGKKLDLRTIRVDDWEEVDKVVCSMSQK